MDLVGGSLACGGSRNGAADLTLVEHGKRDMHSATCRSHVFDFILFGFSTFGPYDPAVEELLQCICQ